MRNYPVVKDGSYNLPLYVMSPGRELKETKILRVMNVTLKQS